MIISVDEQQSVIAAVCRKHDLERLLIFVSTIREDFRTKNNAA
jgi:hypothetical protein